MTVTLAEIEKAAHTIKGAVLHTPTIYLPRLSAEHSTDLYFKLELFQRTGSFKERGALNRLSLLSPAERKTGVIACSAGNHAQGLAYHAQRLGIPATIVMPVTAPFTKVERTRAYGATVVQEGERIDTSFAAMERLAKESGMTIVHPFDDPAIIAGQGTIGLEMLADVPDLDIIVVPIGGGGLISGIATAAKALKPGIEIVGVESALFPKVRNALEGKPPPKGGASIADGIAVKQASPLTLSIIEKLVSRIALVNEDALEKAIHALAIKGKLVAEGAGAAGYAAVMEQPALFSGKKTGIVLCGGNIDSRLLSSLLMRGLVRDSRIVHIRLEIPDEPGVLARVSQIIGAANANIIEVTHQRLLQNVPLKNAELEVVMETRDRAHVDEIIGKLESAGFTTLLMSAA